MGRLAGGARRGGWAREGTKEGTRGQGFPPGQAMGHGGYHLLLILCWVPPSRSSFGGALGREINQAPADTDKQNRF